MSRIERKMSYKNGNIFNLEWVFGMDLYDAVYKRKSTRNYSQENLSRDIIENIEREISEVDELFPDCRTDYDIVDYDEVEDFISGIVGGYGKVEAPHYILAFSEESQECLVNLGYILERVVLEITSMEIATCWVGSHFDKETLKENFGTYKDLYPIVLTAFGKSQSDENTLRSNPDAASRKEISELVLDDIDDVPDKWLKVLDAARMAPSAMNSQPWRFKVKDSGIDLYIETGGGIINKIGKTFGNLEEMNKIDLGIALCHIQIGAEKFSIDIGFQKLEEGEKDSLSYVISIFEES